MHVPKGLFGRAMERVEEACVGCCDSLGLGSWWQEAATGLTNNKLHRRPLWLN